MRRSLLVTVIAACACVQSLVNGAPTDDGLWFISPMKVRVEPAMSYLAVSGKSSFDTMSEDAPKRSQEVREAMMKGAGRPTGASMFIYHGAFPRDGSTEFDVDVGLPVADGARESGDVKVQKLAEFKCASVVFAGRMEKIRDAYASLLEATANAGLQPTGERRERYLMFHGVEEEDNVVMLELGVQ